jgi:hypothetical protein
MLQGEVIMIHKRFLVYLVSLTLMLLIINSVSAQTQEKDYDWERISENLIVGIQSGNPGVQQAAMRLVIQHPQKLNVDEALNDLMHIYRFNEDSKMRQLALVTLHKIGSEYAMDFAKRNLEFETDEKILKLSQAALCDCARKNLFVTRDVVQSDSLVASR